MKDKVRLLLAILLFLAAPFAMGRQEPPAPQRIQVESALVTVPVIVSDARGKYVPGLSSNDFKLFEDGAQVPVPLFLTADDPIKIALLLDTSRSTTTVLGQIKKSAARFLQQMRPQDQATVLSFDSEVTVLCPLTADLQEIGRAIDQAKAGGSGTRMRDAIIQTVVERFRTISGRKAIVLLTDGQDHGSGISAEGLIDGVAASSTLIYSIFYHVDPHELMKEIIGSSARLPKAVKQKDGARDPWQQREEQAAEYLDRISEASAGRFYRSGVTEFDKTFKQILTELRSQYLLGYYPDKSKLDGKSHVLDVQVSVQDVVVRSRRSYRAVH
jgi:VWFA-related protein